MTLRWNTTAISVADNVSVPMGIVIDVSNTLFAVDSNQSLVKKYSIGNVSGTTVAGSFNPVRGNLTTELSSPNDIAIDSYGNVYVADTNNHRIMLWSANATSGIQVAGTGGKKLVQQNDLVLNVPIQKMYSNR